MIIHDGLNDYYDHSGPEDRKRVLGRVGRDLFLDENALSSVLPLPELCMAPRLPVWVEPCWIVIGGVAWPAALCGPEGSGLRILSFSAVAYTPEELYVFSALPESPFTESIRRHLRREPIDILEVWRATGSVCGVVWRDAEEGRVRAADWPAVSTIGADRRVPVDAAWQAVARFSKFAPG